MASWPSKTYNTQVGCFFLNELFEQAKEIVIS